MNNSIYNNDATNTGTQPAVKSELFTYGIPLMKSYSMNYPEPDQIQLQQQQQAYSLKQQQQHQQTQAPVQQPVPQPSQAQQYGVGAHYDSRYYQSPVVMQQPFLQPNNNPKMGLPQSQWVETYPVNNYLLIPNSSIQYNQAYRQKPVDGQYGAEHHQHMAPPPPPNPYAHHMSMQQPQPQPPSNPQVQQHQQPAQQIQPPPQQVHQPQPHSQHPHAQQLQQQQTLVQSLQPAQMTALNMHSRAQSQASNPPEASVIYPNFIERLSALLPSPPLAKAKVRPELNYSINQKRVKRRSKFTKEQDELVVALKKSGKSWVEIAEISKVGSYLAARNRYQVIVGQQGNNNSSSWGAEDKAVLRKKLDEAELEKWEYLSQELNKATGKNFTAKECRVAIQVLFKRDPLQFGVNEVTIQECEKERKITEKANEQDYKNTSVQPYERIGAGEASSQKPFNRQRLPQHGQRGSQHKKANSTNAIGTQLGDQSAAETTGHQLSNPQTHLSAGPQGHQPNLPHYKSANSVFENNAPYGFGDEYASSRSSLEPVDNYKMNQGNLMHGFY